MAAYYFTVCIQPVPSGEMFRLSLVCTHNSLFFCHYLGCYNKHPGPYTLVQLWESSCRINSEQRMWLFCHFLAPPGERQFGTGRTWAWLGCRPGNLATWAAELQGFGVRFIKWARTVLIGGCDQCNETWLHHTQHHACGNLRGLRDLPSR